MLPSVDLALLIIGIISAVAAIAAAVFALPSFLSSRRRPNLLLRPRGRVNTNPLPGQDGWHVLSFDLELHNDGKGWARGWRVKIRTPGHPHGKIGLRSYTPEGQGHDQHLMKDGRRIVEWWTVEEGEAVPPGQDHPLPTGCTAEVPPGGKVVGDYLILAEGFGPKEGTIEVAYTEDQDGRVTVL
jgi:hypothetical protein